MKNIFLILILNFLLLSCGKEQGDILDFSSVGDEEVVPPEPLLVIGSQDTNHRGYATYNLDGELVSVGHFREELGVVRGLSAFDEDSFLVGLEGTDSVFIVNRAGDKTLLHGSAQFTGNIYDVLRSNDDFIYAIESNNIEVFNLQGTRRTDKIIPTTVGACVLNQPRGMILNSDGHLVVISRGNGRVLTYDISQTPATCLSTNNIGNSPHGVVLHSVGFLYVTAQGNHQVYRTNIDGSNPVVVWTTNTGIISTPTGIVEHPSGDLIIASSDTDTLERITTAGVRVGDVPFIRDSQALNVGDIAIIGSIEEVQ